MKSDKPRVPTHVLESIDPTNYANVDLDILSSRPLDGLIDAMRHAVDVLYVGGERRTYEAHVELSSHSGVPVDRTIVGLTRLIQRLPPRFRRVWDRAKSREFNLGIYAGLEPRVFELRLKKGTLEAITAVHGSLVVTVYAPDLPRKKGRLKAAPTSPQPADE